MKDLHYEWNIWIALLISFSLFACSKSSIESDEEFCVGEIPDSLTNFIKIDDDDTLLKDAKKKQLHGYICKGAVFEAVNSANVVYRVYDEYNEKSKYGRWWTNVSPFDPPINSVASYRNAYAVCEVWPPDKDGKTFESKLNSMIECTIKEKKRIVIGTTQSVQCGNNISYPKTQHLQIYIKEPKETVMCKQNAEKKWPNLSNRL